MSAGARAVAVTGDVLDSGVDQDEVDLASEFGTFRDAVRAIERGECDATEWTLMRTGNLRGLRELARDLSFGCDVRWIGNGTAWVRVGL